LGSQAEGRRRGQVRGPNSGRERERRISPVIGIQGTPSGPGPGHRSARRERGGAGRWAGRGAGPAAPLPRLRPAGLLFKWRAVGLAAGEERGGGSKRRACGAWCPVAGARVLSLGPRRRAGGGGARRGRDEARQRGRGGARGGPLGGVLRGGRAAGAARGTDHQEGAHGGKARLHEDLSCGSRDRNRPPRGRFNHFRVAGEVSFAQLEFGVIYHCTEERLYTGQRGRGAFCNGQRLQVSKETDLAKALVLTEIGPRRDPATLKLFLSNMERLLHARAHGVRVIGSSTLALCHLAAGAADAYYQFGLHCWDLAAATVIIREAGGIVMDTSGGPLDLMSCRVVAAGTPEMATLVAQALQTIHYGRDDEK
uniref:inositol-phosphate phosphatase n=1 Tax=Oryctolagus cuniculus TaxID=9986 RepID=A0A5F9CRJ1_RABIT